MKNTIEGARKHLNQVVCSWRIEISQDHYEKFVEIFKAAIINKNTYSDILNKFPTPHKHRTD